MKNKNTQIQGPKLAQFLEGLNELQEKYLYVLKPILRMSENGLIPQLVVRNRVPAKGKLPVKRKTKKTRSTGKKKEGKK